MTSLLMTALCVIKIVLQFCKENSLNQTFQTLQSECQVSLNTVDSVETFVSDINNGRWDSVLPQVSQLKLPRNKLEDLYEQPINSISGCLL
ncbi:BnaC05g43480D [Brassica napus]|uniref:BnaC05g43480D protein n=1 Tax=Brassica napus TaxID=3708 RepID=A0A078HV74_BRANA|nr:BnaC05g43480D [Brassica napus]